MRKFLLPVLIGFLILPLFQENALAQWIYNGTPVCTYSENQNSPRIADMGDGTFIITWYDNRGSEIDIYAQKIDAFGNPLWDLDGVLICGVGTSQYSPLPVSDGNGGAIIVWQDYRNGNSDYYAQRINTDGITQWTSGGVAVCLHTSYQYDINIAEDGLGGAFFCWRDNRDGNYDLFAQRLDSSGAMQ